MTLYETRRSIRHLVDEHSPRDGMAAYYAFHHDDGKTQIFAEPPQTERAQGFITISRTGIDLFRPFVTMRLPIEDLDASAALLQRALPAGSEAFAAVPQAYAPLIRAFCEIRSEEPLTLFQLDPRRYETEVNVLVSREDQNGLSRFVIKQPINNRRTTVAAAGLNWQSPHFAEIAVHTRSEYRQRGFGRAVVRALAGHLLQHHRIPLYAVNPQNRPSVQIAERLGFTNTGHQELMFELQMKGSPLP